MLCTEEETDPEGRKMLSQVGRFTAVGLEIGIAMAVGVIGGHYLDETFDTAPDFFWFGFIIGLGAGVKAVVDVAKAARKEMNDNESSSTKKD